MNPLKVIIENVPEGKVTMIEKPLHPKDASLGKSAIPFTRTIYIEKDDFRLEDSKDYYRLAPGKTVGLYQSSPITYLSHKTSTSGEVIEIICRLEDGSNGKPVPKPKATIQWVAEHPESGSPVRVDETRIFHQFFKSDDPTSVKPDWKADINPDSLEVVKGAFVEIGFWTLAKQSFIAARKEGKARTEKALKTEAISSSAGDTPRPTSEQLVGNECVRFQALRIAYFALDKDAKVACIDEKEDISPVRRDGDFIVLNRLVTLKEDAAKKS
jgi:glutaminyl-tRNA synthetase